MEDLLNSTRRLKAAVSASLGTTYIDSRREPKEDNSLEQLVNSSLSRSLQILDWNKTLGDRYSQTLEGMYNDIICEEKSRVPTKVGEGEVTDCRSSGARHVIPHHVIKILRQIYLINPKPNKRDLEAIATRTGIKKQKISQWFKNTRYRLS